MERFDFLDQLGSAYKGGSEDLRRQILSVLSEIGVIHQDGGPGSGNWGHEGRPGLVGGSMEGGGAHNRRSLPSGYSSSAKMRAKLSKDHKFGEYGSEDIAAMQRPGAFAIIDGVRYYKTGSQNKIMNGLTGEVVALQDVNGKSCKLVVPRLDTDAQQILKAGGKTMTEMNELYENATFPEDPREADKMYREQCGKVWQGLTLQARQDMYEYTAGDSDEVNKVLRAKDADAVSGGYEATVHREIGSMTRAIGQSKTQKDVVFQRGIGPAAFETMFGFALSDDTAQTCVGYVGRDNGFLSCGSTKDRGFTTKKIQLELLAPEGTQAMYAEPWSAFGKGDKKYWDGKSGQDFFSSENETILQRGTSIAILGVEKKQNKYGVEQWRVKCAVRDQRANSVANFGWSV